MMTRPITTITLIGNSPGEVSTFVRPVADELARRHPRWKTEIALVPCPYATGAEADVIRGWQLTDEVWAPAQTTRKWLRGRRAEGPGLACFLGGDPWHALLWKWRFKVPAIAYFSEPSTWEQTRWLGGFDRVLLGYRGQHESRGPRFESLGDLRVDAVRARLAAFQSLAQRQGPGTLAIFPGSRWLHLKATLAPFLRVADLLHQQRPGRRFVLSVSPFVSRAQLSDAASRPFSLGLAGSRARIEGDLLITEGGTAVELIWGDPYRAIAQCDLALSLPGTNTAELAIAGKPAVIPLSHRVPVGGAGLLGLLDRLPGFGLLKTHLKKRKHKRLGLLALPNQLAGRMVMPEFFVRDDLTDLFDFLSQLLDNAAELERIGSEAREVMGPPGAARRFVDTVEAVLEKS
jgi:lipid-A-disaccharide synthase